VCVCVLCVCVCVCVIRDTLRRVLRLQHRDTPGSNVHLHIWMEVCVCLCILYCIIYYVRRMLYCIFREYILYYIFLGVFYIVLLYTTHTHTHIHTHTHMRRRSLMPCIRMDLRIIHTHTHTGVRGCSE
jgi:hypothetical protein